MNVFDEIIKSNLFNTVPNKNMEKEQDKRSQKKIKSSKNSIVFYMEEQVEKLFEIANGSIKEQKDEKDLMLERIQSEQVPEVSRQL